MIRRARVPFLLLAAMPIFSVAAEGIIKVRELESQFGRLQGQIEMSKQTVLLFPGAKVKVSHETGKAKIERIDAQGSMIRSSTRPSLPDLRALKRKINRLPAHEQVRYWKLHQIRYPESTVADELDAAFDLMEAVRKEAFVVQQQEDQESEPVRRSYNRYRSSGLSYFPSYGYTSSRRYRRARHQDTQIELDRIQRERPPAESWNTAMSLADRARSEAWGRVSGARSAILGNTR
jgi:hypothetical protein